MDSASIEDTSHPTSSPMIRNRKYNTRTATSSMSRRNSLDWDKSFPSLSSLIKNKNLCSSLLKISKESYLLDSSSTDSRITWKYALSRLPHSETTEKPLFKISQSSQEEDSSASKLDHLSTTAQAPHKKLKPLLDSPNQSQSPRMIPSSSTEMVKSKYCIT